MPKAKRLRKPPKVVALCGVYPQGSQAQQDVVELLESLLKGAKSGEIAGVACAWVKGNSNISSEYASGCADGNLMMAATHLLHTSLTNVWYGNKD